MHRRNPRLGRAFFCGENISGTMSGANAENFRPERLAEWGCAFITPARWLAGKPPFCGRPTA
ncbi:MAG TPA: hypothetical protein VKV32_13230, partial [Stellaceae bacterium]|nr:hypothetical protein [Stellaceae bacterium]